MKIMKFFIGTLAFMAFCACGNAKPASQASSACGDVVVESRDSVPVATGVAEEVEEQGVVFFDLTLEQALEKAKAENKYVLVNFHTMTCGPCRMMEREVFPLPECGEYINKRFIPIMIDGEDDGVGTEIAQKYKVFIFPTYMVMSPSGFKEGEILGAEYDVHRFLDMLRMVLREI